jgi:hypothetical protein
MASHDVIENFEKALSVHPIDEDLLPSIPACGHVVNGVSELQPRRASHRPSVDLLAPR